MHLDCFTDFVYLENVVTSMLIDPQLQLPDYESLAQLRGVRSKAANPSNIEMMRGKEEKVQKM